jgi:hypothetical protein
MSVKEHAKSMALLMVWFNQTLANFGQYTSTTIDLQDLTNIQSYVFSIEEKLGFIML